MSLLTKFLKKNGINSFDELTSEEKETYRLWEASISGRKLTDEDVKNFLEIELDDAIGKLEDMKLTDREDVFLKMKVSFIRKVREFLATPEKERQAIESQIKSQL